MVKVNHLMGRDQTERVRRRNYRMVETILAFQKTRKEAREAVGGGCLESARIISPNLERSGRVGHVRSGQVGRGCNRIHGMVRDRSTSAKLTFGLFLSISARMLLALSLVFLAAGGALGEGLTRGGVRGRRPRAPVCL
jgi:hypothetical protein